MKAKLFRSVILIVFIAGIVVTAAFFVAPVNRFGYKVWESLGYSLDTNLSKSAFYFCAAFVSLVCFFLFQKNNRWTSFSALVASLVFPLVISQLLGLNIQFPLDYGFYFPLYYEFWIIFSISFAIYFFFTELEPVNYNDSEETDFFQSEAFADSVAKAIERDFENKKTFAITGKWGAGKSYIMNKVCRRLKKKDFHSEILSNYAYTSLEEFLSETFLALSSQLHSYDVYKLVSHMPKQFEASKLTVGFSGRILLGFDRLVGVKKFKYEIEKSSLNKPVILIFDDVDRLSKEQMSILFQGMHLISQIKSVSVLLCQNNNQVDKVFLDLNSNNESYQEKYIDERFEIPEPTINELWEFFKHNLKNSKIDVEDCESTILDCIRFYKEFITPRRIERISLRISRIIENVGDNVLHREVIIISFLYELDSDFTQHILSNLRKYRKSYFLVQNGFRVLTTSIWMNQIPSTSNQTEEGEKNILNNTVAEYGKQNKRSDAFEKAQISLWNLLLEGGNKSGSDFLSIRNDERTDLYGRLLAPTINFDEELFQQIYQDVKKKVKISQNNLNALTIRGLISRISFFDETKIREEFKWVIKFLAIVHDSKSKSVAVEIFSGNFEDSTAIANWLRLYPSIWSTNNVSSFIEELLASNSESIQLFAARIVGEINRGNYTDKSDIKGYLPGLNIVYDQYLNLVCKDSVMTSFNFECLSLSTQIDESRSSTPGKGGGHHSLRPEARRILNMSIENNGFFATWKYCLRKNDGLFEPNWLVGLFYGNRKRLIDIFNTQLDTSELYLLKLFSDTGIRLEQSESEKRSLEALFQTIVKEAI